MTAIWIRSLRVAGVVAALLVVSSAPAPAAEGPLGKKLDAFASAYSKKHVSAAKTASSAGMHVSAQNEYEKARNISWNTRGVGETPTPARGTRALPGPLTFRLGDSVDALARSRDKAGSPASPRTGLCLLLVARLSRHVCLKLRDKRATYKALERPPVM
jgi:hypothetical protein